MSEVENIKQQKIKPRIAAGTRDFGPSEMAIREGVFESIVSVYKQHGAVTIILPLLS